MSHKLEALHFLIEQDVNRPRGSGLTTALYELSKKIGAKFVVHNENEVKRFNDKNVISLNRNIRGIYGSNFIFDHHALAIGASFALGRINELEQADTNHKELNRKLANHNADYAEQVKSLTAQLEKANDLLETSQKILTCYEDVEIETPSSAPQKEYVAFKQAQIIRTYLSQRKAKDET